MDKRVEKAIVEAMKGFNERDAIEVSTVEFDRNHTHMLCRFLPKYSGGQVIRTIKSVFAVTTPAEASMEGRTFRATLPPGRAASRCPRSVQY
jgi:REP element-mobilizing transposase RayT